MKNLFILSVCLFAQLAFAAKEFKGFVQVDSGRELYVEWKPAAPGEPTAILINGLTYSTRQWQDFAANLSQQGVGVLRFDMMGMGQTLLKYAPIIEAIDHREQVEDLRSLLQTLKVPKPYHLLGLSYGGGIAFAYSAKYPKEVGQIIAMAPFTEPLQAQDLWIKNQVATTRVLYPNNPATDDELYDFFLHQIVYQTYPAAEPIVLENPFKLEATFRMVQGIRHFRAARVLKALPKKSLHLIIAGNDQYIPRDVLEDFWSKVPADVALSKIIIQGSEHKIPEACPQFSAQIVRQMLRKDRRFTGGRQYEADPVTGRVEEN